MGIAQYNGVQSLTLDRIYGLSGHVGYAVIEY
jgi:hypothetical protein